MRNSMAIEKIQAIFDEKHIYVDRTISKKYQEPLNGMKPILTFKGLWQMFVTYYVVVYEDGSVKRYFPLKNNSKRKYMEKNHADVLNEDIWYIPKSLISNFIK